MTENLAIAAATAAISLSSSVIAIYVRSVKSDLLTEMSRVKAEIVNHINGSYVRKESCVLREEAMGGILNKLRDDIDRDAFARSGRDKP